MADKKEKKVTASEIAGELRRMAKFYEIFSSASEIATVLAKKEAIEKKLKASVISLEKERDQLDATCDTLAHKIDNRKEQLTELDVKVSSAEAEYQGILRTATQKANAEAAQITGGAEANLRELNAHIEESKEKDNTLRHTIQHAEQELSDVYQRIEEVKANALKALA